MLWSNYIDQNGELINHLYRIYGILVCIHAYRRNRTHKRESRIIYVGTGAFDSPEMKQPNYPVFPNSWAE